MAQAQKDLGEVGPGQVGHDRAGVALMPITAARASSI